MAHDANEHPHVKAAREAAEKASALHMLLKEAHEGQKLGASKRPGQTGAQPSNADGSMSPLGGAAVPMGR